MTKLCRLTASGMRYPTGMALRFALRVTLRYGDKTYTFVPECRGEALLCDDWAGALYQWTQGNFGCDCNRSLFIQRQCDPDFPDLECGEQIALVALQRV